MKIYYEQDAELDLIQGKKVGVVGYGSQGHAHALNLKDNGVDVRIGLQASSASKPKAEAEGLTVASPSEITQWADVVMILVPDEKQAVLWANEIEPHVRDGQHVMLVPTTGYAEGVTLVGVLIQLAIRRLETIRTRLIAAFRLNPAAELIPMRSWLQKLKVSPVLSKIERLDAEVFTGETRALANQFRSDLEEDLHEIRAHFQMED